MSKVRIRPDFVSSFVLISWDEITAALEHINIDYRGRNYATACGNPARAMAIWFTGHGGGMSLEQIRAALEASSHSAVGMQVGRLQRQLPENAKLRCRLKAVGKRLDVQC